MAAENEERKPRRLKGHTSTATCCISSRDRHGFLATAGEDGCVCLFDLRCQIVQQVMKLADDAISSICFKQGNENIIYLSSGTEVRCFDVRMATPEKPLESYNYNQDEINQISCNLKSSFLAAADDSGDVKICSSVQFVPWKPWEVITGGLDSKMIMWDFSKGRPFLIVDFGKIEHKNGNDGQFYNPPFIHSIAVPETDMLERSGKICAVARGDGTVSIINIESELAVAKSKGKMKSLNSTRGSSSTGNSGGTENQNEWKRLHLEYSHGGHSASASCVTFSSFGEKGKLLISGGNDKSVKIWDWSQYLDETKTCASTNVAVSINLQKKVNWLCTTPADSENLVVCDTSKVVKVYTVS
ncbi:hypothetical protein KSS87_021067 [Heliosperma pusillum]|nr:hypothetical protein KSS87_021067 [Heliosperma pusillum]